MEAHVKAAGSSTVRLPADAYAFLCWQQALHSHGSLPSASESLYPWLGKEATHENTHIRTHTFPCTAPACACVRLQRAAQTRGPHPYDPAQHHPGHLRHTAREPEKQCVRDLHTGGPHPYDPAEHHPGHLIGTAMQTTEAVP
eukprot:1161027-Pelagomonas_calceolata.AAC.5